MVETTHKFAVHTSTDLMLTIETIHAPSQIKHRSPVYVIKKGISSIPYQVPFVDNNSRLGIIIHIRGDICTNIIECQSSTSVIGRFINETRQIELIYKNFIIFAETDKPIYKPGEKVKLRFMPIYPTNLMREIVFTEQVIILNSNNEYQLVKNKNRNMFDIIIIENSNGERVAQWRNVSIENSMNLEYQLTKDPIFGLWKSKAMYNGQEEIIQFRIKTYVLPRFVVNVYPPDQILGKNKLIKYKVCAKYSTGKRMIAQIESNFCMIFNDLEENCQTIKSVLTKNYCLKIKLLTKNLYNLTSKYRYANSKSRIDVSVTENGTSSVVSKTVEGSGINFSSYNIIFESKLYFKPGLPYFGRIKLVQHNNKPQKNEIITIFIEHWGGTDYWGKIINWGFERNYSSDQNGVIEFIIPFIPIDSSFTIQMMGIYDETEKVMTKPILYKKIAKWESIEKQYLQILPIKSTLKCPGNLNLTILTNHDISSINMYAQIFSRGQITEMIEYPSIPVKCDSRNDFFGHYDCVNGSTLVCLTGWKGGNCREPICDGGCLNGACVKPNKCICKVRWKGKNCDQCVIAPYCKHGYCTNNSHCKCLPRWSGFDCSMKGPKVHHSYQSLTSQKPRNFEIKPNNIKKYETQTIFERILTVPLLKNMGPDVHIIVYFITPGKEIVADAVEISHGLENCSHLGGGIFKFDKNISLPKSKIVLTVDPEMQNTSCAVRIADVALSQLGQSSNADLSHLIQKLIKLNHKITRYNSRSLDSRKNCLLSTSEKIIYDYMFMTTSFESRMVLEQAGFTSITNARIINTKCRYIQRVYYSLAMNDVLEKKVIREQYVDTKRKEPPGKNVKDTTKKDDLKLKLKNQIREYFPESWLFSYFNETTKLVNLTVPDSMTTWQADSFCMTEKGIWIAPSQKLTVIMSFFTDIYVPYSIKLDEELSLPVKLFNYVDSCYEIRVEIDVNSNEIYVVGLKSFVLCVCSNNEKTVYFKIRPKIIGKLNITIDSTSKYSDFCSIKNQSKKPIEMSDSVRRQLLVEPQGVPTETTFSELICNKNEQLGIIELFTIPTEIVAGSLRSYLTFNGDVMGQTFDNLDKLVKMPYGCGEQNMVAVVPSIYVLEYLNKLQINNPELTQKAKRYIVHGYVRQLTYKHVDGSFSAFGKTDKFGSTWLTAFVLRSFHDASKYVNIDKSVLMEAVKYLEKMQLQNGCFKEYGKLFHSTMAGGVKKNDNTDDSLLTAYVLISLKTMKITKTSFNITQAVKCIQSGLKTNPSNYRLALTAYALSFYQKFSNSLMEQLLNRSISVGRYKYWPFDKESDDKQKVNSADIETTGYAFLALQNYQSLSDSLKTVYWLSNQRNSLGGYYSTQDTVVALNALAVFAETIGLSGEVNLNVHIVLNHNKNYSDLITSDNRLVSRTFDLGTENISYVSMKTNGSGCVSIQLISLYNINKLYSAKDTFKLSVKTDIISSKQCNIRKIKVCFAYLRRDKNSNMILLTIDYPSGWELSEQESKYLSLQISTPLNRIDFQKNKMELYYDAFSYNNAGKISCFQFQLEEKSKISNLQPALVKIVDYYNPETYMDASYVMFNKECNKTDSKIPEVSKILLCPICVKDSQESTLQFIQTICQSWFNGFVSGGQNDTKNRTLYEAQQSVFYEWKLDLEPTNCSCLKTWPDLKNGFVILSSKWKSLNEKVVLSNDSVMFPLNTLYSAYKFDLQSQCRVANNFYSMMNRIMPDFANKIEKNDTCAACIVSANYYFNIKNITAWYCANYTDWKFEISSVSPIIKGVLKNNVSTIHVEVEFPNHQCYCCEQIRNLKKSFRIVDLKNRIQAIDNKSNKPIKLLLNNEYEVVEENVFSLNKHIKCVK